MRKILALLLLAATAAWAAPTTREIADRVLPATVLIEAMTPHGMSLGSGVLVDTKGAVLTALHVVAGATAVTVKLPGGTALPVLGVLAIDAHHDLALLRVQGDALPTVPLGAAAALGAGDKVIVIGSPEGLDHSVSDGVVSAVRRIGAFPADHRRELQLDGWSDDDTLIQLTAPIAPGSSGGPVFNTEGALVGIVILKVVAEEKIGFAVPVEHARPLLLSQTVTPLPVAGTAAAPPAAPGNDYAQGAADGERDGDGNFLWAPVGCAAGVLSPLYSLAVIPLAYISPVSSPSAAQFVGKSPEYVRGYLHAFSAERHRDNAGVACCGVAAGCCINGIFELGRHNRRGW